MNTREYNNIVDVHSDGLYRFIVKNLKDSDTAQDIVQDSFEKLWVVHSRIEFVKAKSYLYTTGYHTMIDYIRKNSRVGVLTDSLENTVFYVNEYKGLVFYDLIS